MRYYSHMGIQREKRRQKGMVKEFIIGIGCVVFFFALMLISMALWGG